MELIGLSKTKVSKSHLDEYRQEREKQNETKNPKPPQFLHSGTE